MKKILYILLLTVSFASCQTKATEQNVSLIPPNEFAQQMAANKGRIIDVRTPKEFSAGHIEGAQNVHVYDKDFEQRIDKLAKDEPVYVYCKVGGRSAEAVEILKAKGFTHIIELEGGMDAWLGAGEPVTK